MHLLKHSIFFICIISFVVPVCHSQDTIASPFTWQSSAKKIGNGSYEITFKTPGAGSWQLYAPDQLISDVKAAELIFPDSNIVQQGNFVGAGDVKTIRSEIFDNTPVKVFEQGSEWKAIIHINGEVPAQLRGTLHYTYGKGDEFY